ncbi:subtilase family protein [Dysgonomonas alginatilytica]|uniref:Subtilase family protein n=1 Tax=Dysgonomonas alginatilytica TaxID=1605892 RepID=A0A2V3PLX1_9BACT|nr:S8 family serine peptidase [Dysgonomonas alginatilytica]PXV62356.1 subtilase family protein [Dysgonomonas alginatilytica]
MKRIIFYIILIIASQSIMCQNYYWYKGAKIPLTEKSDKRFILTTSSNSTQVASTLQQQGLKYSAFQAMSIAGVNTYSAGTQSTSWSFVEGSTVQTATANNTTIIYEAPFYIMNGKEVGLSQIFYVKLKSSAGVNDLMNLASLHKVEIVGENKFMPLWFTLTCTKASTGNALKMANLFFESNKFAAAVPDIIDNIKTTCDNDPLFSSQWALRNTAQKGGTSGIDINYCNAKTLSTGSTSLVIAVFDTGFELNHPDLNASSLSYDTKTATSPSKIYGHHGTACAGIITAKSNNSLGVSGIAPSSKSMSLSFQFGYSPNAAQEISNGINYATNNGASVISNSWGGGASSDMIDDAYTNALTKGRNGLGCVVVFAAGNDNSGYIGYPANSNPDFIVVGAMNQCAQRKSPTSCDGETTWGGNYGTILDVSAPGVLIPTTDRQGSAGYATGDYVMNFNGTSAACPHVAGTAALMLSVNPSLTQKQVADIIESTSRKIGSYTYSTTSGRTNGTWNNELGYGLVDAYAAVLKAKAGSCSTITYSNQTVTANTAVTGCIVNAANDYVNSGKLTVTATDYTIINPIFEVKLGAELELK